MYGSVVPVNSVYIRTLPDLMVCLVFKHQCHLSDHQSPRIVTRHSISRTTLSGS